MINNESNESNKIIKTVGPVHVTPNVSTSNISSNMNGNPVQRFNIEGRYDTLPKVSPLKWEEQEKYEKYLESIEACLKNGYNVKNYLSVSQSVLPPHKSIIDGSTLPDYVFRVKFKGKVYTWADGLREHYMMKYNIELSEPFKKFLDEYIVYLKSKIPKIDDKNIDNKHVNKNKSNKNECKTNKIKKKIPKRTNVQTN